MPNVSFVITFYNKAPFVRSVLNSAFSQEGGIEGEYIFIDDGSTDDTLSLLQEHSRGKKNVHIIHQENAGPAVATNRGIEAATAPYIKFVDGDDILHPRSAIELIRAVEETGAELAYSLGEEILTSSEKMDAPDVPLPDVPSVIVESPLDEIIKKAIFNLSCVLVSTKAAREVGGCDPNVFIQDYSIALRFAARTKFVFVPKILHWTSLDVDSRVSGMGGGAQVLHDLNLSLAHFLAENPGLSSSLKTRIFRRATGRAWKWARRVGGASVFSPHFFNYITALLLPGAANMGKLILSSCDAFRDTYSVRLISRRLIDGKS